MTSSFSYNMVTLPPISEITSSEETQETPIHIHQSVEQSDRISNVGNKTDTTSVIPQVPYRHQTHDLFPQLLRMQCQPRSSFAFPSLLSYQPNIPQPPHLNQSNLYYQRPPQIGKPLNIMPHPSNLELYPPDPNEQMRYPPLVYVVGLSPTTGPSSEHSQQVNHQLLPHQLLSDQRQQQPQQLQTVLTDMTFPPLPHPQLVVIPVPHHPVEFPLYCPQIDMSTSYGQEHHFEVFSGSQREPPVKKIRRTRTGCQTCRNRRVKCDERKPFCYNCQRLKRVCLGYMNK